MKKLFTVLGILALGAALGRLFDGVPPRAEAGGGRGGGVEKCAAENGDVNADGDVDLGDAISILGYLFNGNPLQLVPLCGTIVVPPGLPKTGQTLCYGFVEGQGWVPAPCAEATCPGQDGAYATGCPSGGRFVDNGDGTVTDTCTGLIWQKDRADVTGDGQSNVADSLPWCQALEYCENLRFAGHDDWRLPNVRELQSIVDYGRFTPAIDPFFGGDSISAAEYWSSTSWAYNPGVAWFVHFSAGNVSLSGKVTSSYYVRAVRSGP